MPRRRKSYSAAYKLQVAKYAAENGNRVAGRKFGVNEKLVRDWRKAEDTLNAMKKTKKANRGLKARWPEVEEQLHKWFLEQRSAGITLSTLQLRLHAREVARAMNIDDFRGGSSWCYRFMQRNRLTVRNRTTTSRDLPADFQAKVDLFREFLVKQEDEHNVTELLGEQEDEHDVTELLVKQEDEHNTTEFLVKQEDEHDDVTEFLVKQEDERDVTPEQIINMDEVPLRGKSVEKKRQKRVKKVTAGLEKSHFTVVLACCEDGSKLPPINIFKRKTRSKTQPPSAVVKESRKGGS